MIAVVRIAAVLVTAHLGAWIATFVALVGFSPEYMPAYFMDAWSFSAGELPSLVWLYSWIVFGAVLGAFLGIRSLLKRRATDA